MSSRVSSFVPQLLTRRFRTRIEPLRRSESERFPGILLFADVTGSTSLIEHMGQLGSADGDEAETMMRLMNSCFAPIMELIEAHGGDVIKFAGDGLMALWQFDERAPHPQLVRAAHCALKCQSFLQEASSDGLALKLRVCVSVGELLVAHLGGIYNRWELLVAGTPLTQLKACLSSCSPGGVVLSREAYLPLERYVAATPVKSSQNSVECYNVLRLLGPEPPARLSLKFPVPDAAPLPESAPMALALKAYLPRSLVYQLECQPLSWIAERRQVTSVFVALPGLESLAEYHLDLAQEIMQTCQRCIYREEGSVIRLNADDKGVVLMCAFGLSPHPHPDDPVRAVLASMAIQRELERLGQPCSIGVATGRVFSGSVGGARRAEYTLVGDCVNLAARLMAAATTILCDRTTAEATMPMVEFDHPLPIQVKGKRALIDVYIPAMITECRSEKPSANLQTTALPESMIMAWVDRLPSAHRLLLRVASFLEGAFTAELLSALHPVSALKGEVVETLEALTRKGLLCRISDRGGVRYCFESEETCRVIASTLSQEQHQLLRKSLWEQEQRHSSLARDRASFI